MGSKMAERQFQTEALQIFSKSNLVFLCVTKQQYQLLVIFVSYHKLNLGAAFKSILPVEKRME